MSDMIQKVIIIKRMEINLVTTRHLFLFQKHDFNLWIGGDGLDMHQQLEGGFGSMRAMLPM